jgi:hypothetical protein
LEPIRSTIHKSIQEVKGKTTPFTRNRSAFGYLEPKPNTDIKDFANCKTCQLWIKDKKRCYWLSNTKEVDEDDSCIYYAPGKPMPARVKPTSTFTPTEVGFYDGKVRCENCVSFSSGKCKLFTLLNSLHPTIWDLDATVNKHGCCNAFYPKD